MPSTFAQGFLSGIGHPVIGIDHLLFIIGIGLLAAFTSRKLLLPLAFIGGTWIGAALHLFGLNVSFAEVGIIASVLLMAVAVIGNVRLSVPVFAALIAFAGLFHGYAYAESIFGADAGALYAYLFGFAVIQFAIAFAAASVFELVQKRSGPLATAGARVSGGAMVGVAMVAISSMLAPV
ncbi:MAG: HupE/UreJ family protein [Xanthobacteraceae bacterium]